MKVLTANQVEALMADGDVILVSLDDRELFEHGHIPRSRNAPANAENFMERIRSLVDRPNTPVIIYSSGPVSNSCCLRAGRTMKLFGFSEVFVFGGGIWEWIKAGKRIDAGGF